MKRLLCLLAVVCSAWAEVPTAIAIHNARIIPVSGPAIDRGTVVLRNGLIESVGANVNPPADAWIIEAQDFLQLATLLHQRVAFRESQLLTVWHAGRVQQSLVVESTSFDH